MTQSGRLKSEPNKLNPYYSFLVISIPLSQYLFDIGGKYRSIAVEKLTILKMQGSSS